MTVTALIAALIGFVLCLGLMDVAFRMAGLHR